MLHLGPELSIIVLEEGDLVGGNPIGRLSAD